uniref:Calcium binding and coiled-coil domain 1 n=1 Tax=Sphenodon punctatus TaxID=8508 RepID=A0A8D0GM09_SPHPU
TPTSPLSSMPSSPRGVAFLNVAPSYVPHTRVECHYTLPPSTKPSARDWVGIFKAEVTSVRDYYTFVWCTVPESGGVTGAPIHCSVQFQASYLPKPGAQQYQFRYVDRRGEVRGQSSPFRFNEPRPMDELVTLEEAGDDGGTDMLVVVPKATVLQSQLEESQQERGALLRERHRLEDEVEELRRRVTELEEALGSLRDEHNKLAGQYKELSGSHEAVSEQRKTLSRQVAEREARIRELEADAQAMGQRLLEKEVKLQASEKESRSLACDLQEAMTLHGQKLSQTLLLQEEMVQLKHKLGIAQRRTVSTGIPHSTGLDWGEGAPPAAGSSTGESTNTPLIADLHRSRLEVAETNIKLADMTLKWKEGKSQWWKEKAVLLQNVETEKDKILKLSAEVLRLEQSVQEERAQRQGLCAELARERDSSLVQVSEGRRELRELRAALQVVQKDKEQLQSEKQEMLSYARRLEERLEKVADEKWSEVATGDEDELVSGSLDSPLSDSEDESPEDMRLPAQLGRYSLCDNRGAPCTPPSSREPARTVVISQPAPIAAQMAQPPEETSSDSEAEDEKAVLMAAVQNGGEEASLLLPELSSAVYEVASLGSPGPLCRERFSLDSRQGGLEKHGDGHYFFSAHPPFAFD